MLVFFGQVLSRIAGSYGRSIVNYLYTVFSRLVYAFITVCYFLTLMLYSWIQPCPPQFEFKTSSTQQFSVISEYSSQNWMWLSPSDMIDWLIYLSLKYAHMTYNFVLKNTEKTVMQLPAPWKLAFLQIWIAKYRWSTPTNWECLERPVT